MKAGDLVRIGYPQYFEEYWEQIGIIIETEDTPHPLRILTSVGIAWFSSGEVEIVNDDTDGYDRDKEST
jgi:hypothetical protein